jgi:DUF4097 and DUF4098 domain-containing protein YvlB
MESAMNTFSTNRSKQSTAALRLAFSLIALTVFLTTACTADAHTTSVFRKIYPLSPGGRFTLENVNGSVHVDGWDRDEVQVEAIKTSTFGDDSEVERVSIEVNAQPMDVAVRTRYPHGGGAEVAVEYVVHVPYRVLLGDVQTVNGSVSVHNVAGTGTGDLRSVNGNVEVLDSSGRFSAHTTNGNIQLELKQLTDGDPMNLETINGSVLLKLPKEAHAQLHANSMNGDFYSELPVAARNGGRYFSGELGSGGADINMRTVNGAIRLAMGRPSTWKEPIP